MEKIDAMKPLFPHLPERLAGLEVLAENLWWSWNPGARMLFKTLDRQAWKESGHNPNKMLRDFPRELLEKAGDRWYVGVIARIDIPLIDSLLTNQHLSQYSVEEIRNTLGESVCFQQKRERHYIDEREKDDLLNGLMDSFIKRTLNYLSLPDFPGKYVLKEFQAYRKRKTWYQNV